MEKLYDYYISRTTDKMHRADWIAQSLGNRPAVLCGSVMRRMGGIQPTRFGVEAVLAGERLPITACKKCFAKEVAS